MAKGRTSNYYNQKASERRAERYYRRWLTFLALDERCSLESKAEEYFSDLTLEPCGVDFGSTDSGGSCSIDSAPVLRATVVY